MEIPTRSSSNPPITVWSGGREIALQLTPYICQKLTPIIGKDPQGEVGPLLAGLDDSTKSSAIVEALADIPENGKEGERPTKEWLDRNMSIVEIHDVAVAILEIWSAAKSKLKKIERLLPGNGQPAAGTPPGITLNSAPSEPSISDSR